MKNKVIDSFRDKYEFLSNFYPCRVDYEGKSFGSTEQAYQYYKTLDPYFREKIFNSSPSKSKKITKEKDFPIREDWSQIKLGIMEDLLRIKFKNPNLRDLLLKTGNSFIIEGNTWNDTFWGVCNNIGENNLGKLLMKIRDEIRNS